MFIIINTPGRGWSTETLSWKLKMDALSPRYEGMKVWKRSYNIHPDGVCTVNSAWGNNPRSQTRPFRLEKQMSLQRSEKWGKRGKKKRTQTKRKKSMHTCNHTHMHVWTHEPAHKAGKPCSNCETLWCSSKCVIAPNRKCVEQASAAHLSVQRGGTGVCAGGKKRKYKRKKAKEKKKERKVWALREVLCTATRRVYTTCHLLMGAHTPCLSPECYTEETISQCVQAGRN